MKLSSIALLSLLALSSPLGAQTPPVMAPAAAPTGVQRFDLRTNGQSRVLFTSDAPLETVDGISTSTAGGFTVDLANPSRQLSGRVEVTATTLRTGVDLRDEHLRGENWLDAAHHPSITLELVGTTLATPIAPNRPVTARVRGRFTLHGVTREVTVPVTVRLIPLSGEYAGMEGIGINADMLRVQGEFHLALTDYGISVPALLRLKVSNDIRVRVDLTAFRHAA